MGTQLHLRVQIWVAPVLAAMPRGLVGLSLGLHHNIECVVDFRQVQDKYNIQKNKGIASIQ
jgi:hypothetical protein